MSFNMKFALVFLSGYALGMYTSALILEKEINKLIAVAVIGETK